MISLKVFGSIDLENGKLGRVSSLLSQPKRLGLFVYLLLEQPKGLQRRDSLTAVFWPEADADRARGSLSQALHYLRRTVGEQVVLSRGTEEIGVDVSSVTCDALDFQEHLRLGQFNQAMDLYRGDFLHGYHLTGVPDFAEWIVRLRDRFRREAIGATWKLAYRARSSGDSSESIRWARRGQELDPFGEESIRNLITLLDAAGHRSEAVRAYNDFASRLHRELDAVPTPESEATFQRIQKRKELAEVIPTVDPVTRPSRSGDVPDVGGSALSPPRLSPVIAELNRSTGSKRLVGNPEHVPSGHGWSRRLPWAASSLIVVLIASVLWLRHSGRGTLDPNRVFVSGFVNRTGDRELDAVGLLAGDWVIEALQQTSLVVVVDPATALAYGQRLPVEPIAPIESPLNLARQTASGTVISGSLYLRNDSVSFHAQIIDVKRRVILATVSRSTGPRADPLKSLDEFRQRVTGALASVLDERLATLRSPSSQPPTLAAYEEYIAGMTHFIRRDYEEALPYFRQAVQLDSTFVLPRLWTGFALSWLGLERQADSVIASLLPLRHRLSRMDQHGLDALAATSEGHSRSRIRSPLRQAAALGPQSNWQLMLGQNLLADNRPREAIAVLEQLDADRGWVRGWDPYWVALLGAYHMIGNYPGEMRAAMRAGKSGSPPLEFRARSLFALFRTRPLAALGQTPEAMALATSLLEEPAKGGVPYAERTVARDANPDLVWYVARELDYHGYHKAADTLERQALSWFLRQQMRPGFTPWPGFEHSVGRLQIDLGKYDEAVKTLRQRAESSPDDVRVITDLSSALAFAGDFPGAWKAADQLAAIQSPELTPGKLSYVKAGIAAIGGDKTRALQLLKTAFDEGYLIWPGIHRDIEFRQLWHTPEYKLLVRPKG